MLNTNYFYGMQNAAQLVPLSPLEQAIQQQRIVDEQAGFYALLSHAAAWYNLNNTSPDHKPLPEMVKWQLLNVAKARNEHGVVVGSEHFGFAHLDKPDLALLYKIMHSYICDPRAAGSPIQTHLHKMEEYFMHLANSNPPTATQLIHELKLCDDARLDTLICKLTTQLKIVQLRGHAIISGAQNQSLDQQLAALRHAGNHFISHVDSICIPAANPAGTISTALKQQVLSAAKTSINKGKIVLSPEFSPAQLSPSDLVLLYRILKTYVEPEKDFCHSILQTATAAASAQGRVLSSQEKDCLPTPIFQKPLFALEKHFANLCLQARTNPIAAHKYAATLDALDASIEQSIAAPLKRDLLIAANKFAAFENDPALSKLFECLANDRALGAQPGAGVENYLKNLDAKNCAQLMSQLKNNYQAFLKWMASIAALEKESPSRSLSILKGQFAEAQTDLHTALILKLINVFPARFKDVLGVGIKPHYLPGGMDIMLKKFKAKDGFAADVRICTSYEAYAEQLAALPQGVPGVYHFFVRCAQKGVDQNIHQTPVTVFRDAHETVVFITDSSGFNLEGAGDFISKHTYQVLPAAFVYSTMNLRQRDWANCGFFTLQDTRTLIKDPFCLFNELASKAKPIAEVHASILANNRFDLLAVKATPEIPLRLIKPAQSLSQVSSVLKKAPKDDAFAQKLAELKHRFTMAEMDLGREIYAYTTLKSISYQLHIVQTLFNLAQP